MDLKRQPIIYSLTPASRWWNQIRYARTTDGFIFLHVDVYLNEGLTPVADDVLGILPIGYRPRSSEYISAFTGSTPNICVQVHTDGTISHWRNCGMGGRRAVCAAMFPAAD